jgi:hypothetical protein
MKHSHGSSKKGMLQLAQELGATVRHMATEQRYLVTFETGHEDGTVEAKSKAQVEMVLKTAKAKIQQAEIPAAQPES